MLPSGLHIPRASEPLSYPRLLLVEGRSAFEFFKALLRQIGRLDEIEIRNLGGRAELNDFLLSLTRTRGFANVVSLGIVLDAEEDAPAALASMQTALQRAGLPVPDRHHALAPGEPTVAIFILPDGVAPGMLETLCWRALADDPAVPCVEDYFACLQARGLVEPQNKNKARVHAFLASRPRSELLLGQAAHAGYFPWVHPAFDSLKQFLRAL